ncbi:hypothetical protein HDV03_003759 [Kappamyces sp. JEL0829]|nr:hypothetical protein HDV03_003759 [Kappamyces sp. JEL0829]
MEQYIRLSPPISMIYVRRIDAENHYEMQVVPASNLPPVYSNEDLYISPKNPYHIRRTLSDFESFHKAVMAVAGKPSGASRLSPAEIPLLPVLDTPATSLVELVAPLNQYVASLVALPPDVLNGIPMDKFFGEWIQDRFESRPLLSESLVSKIGAMISMGFDTKDDVLANILKRDQELRKGSTAAPSLVSNAALKQNTKFSSPKPTMQPSTDASGAPKPLAVPVRLHSRSISQDQIKNIMSGQLMSAEVEKTQSRIPTYEEFVSQLAVSLSVDISEKNGEKPLMRDTIMEHADSFRFSAAETIRDSEFPAANQLLKTLNAIEQSGRAAGSPSLDTTLAGGSARTATEGKGERDTLIMEGEEPLEALMASLMRPIKKIHMREESASIEPSKSSVLQRSQSAREAGYNGYGSRSNFQDGESFRPVVRTKSLAKPITTTSPLASASSASSLQSPVTIPSRKDSRNWITSASSDQSKLSLNTQLPDPRSPLRSPSTRRKDSARASPIVSPQSKQLPERSAFGDEKRDYFQPSSLNNTSIPPRDPAKEGFNSLLRSASRRSPSPTPGTDEEASSIVSSNFTVASNRPLKHSNTAMSLRQYLTLKLIQTSGAPTSIKVPLGIDFKSLIDKVAMVAGSMDAKRVCYRDADMEMITMTDEEAWSICKETVPEDKLTLFIMLKPSASV